MHLVPYKLAKGEFELHELLHEDVASKTYRVTRKAYGLEMALKIVQYPKDAETTEVEKPVVTEVGIMVMCMNHPNIQKTQGLFLTDCEFQIALEHMSLNMLKVKQFIQKCEVQMNEQIFKFIAYSVLLGLNCLH